MDKGQETASASDCGRVMTPQDAFDTYMRYLWMKVNERDWHGVADCAMDLRELEAKHPELKRKS